MGAAELGKLFPGDEQLLESMTAEWAARGETWSDGGFDPNNWTPPDSEYMRSFKQPTVAASLDTTVNLALSNETIAIDLDGTLAKKVEPFDPMVIGDPIPERIAEVKRALKVGKNIVIFTARIYDDKDGKIMGAVRKWCQQHIGQDLKVTNEKTPDMIQFIDDRAVAVVPNGTDMPNLSASLDIPLELGGDDEDVKWITVRGQAVPIKDGQDVGEAIKERFGDKFKKSGDKDDEGKKDKPGLISRAVGAVKEGYGKVTKWMEDSERRTTEATKDNFKNADKQLGKLLGRGEPAKEKPVVKNEPAEKPAKDHSKAIMEKFGDKDANKPAEKSVKDHHDEAKDLSTKAKDAKSHREAESAYIRTNNAAQREAVRLEAAGDKEGGAAHRQTMKEAQAAADKHSQAAEEDDPNVSSPREPSHQFSLDIPISLGSSSSLDVPLELGDSMGHPFRGNQWTDHELLAPDNGAGAGGGGGVHQAFVGFKEPMRKVLRWCGKEGMDLGETKAAIRRAGLKLPPDPTIRAELPLGGRGMTRGGRPPAMPKLNQAQKDVLRGEVRATKPDVAAQQARRAMEWVRQHPAGVQPRAPRGRRGAAAPAAPAAPARPKPEDESYAAKKNIIAKVDAALVEVRRRIAGGDREAANVASKEGRVTQAGVHRAEANANDERLKAYNNRLASRKVAAGDPAVLHEVAKARDAHYAGPAVPAAPPVRPGRPAPAPAPPAPAAGKLRVEEMRGSPNRNPDKAKREGELNSTPVKDVEALKPGQHVSKAYKVTDQGGKKFVFKPVAGEARTRGVSEEARDTGPGARREVAAYEVAKCVGMDDLVPVTTMRDQVQVRDDTGNSVSGVGSAQDFLHDCKEAGDSINEWDGAKDAERAAAFDYVLGLMDRHTGNWMIDNNGAADGKIHLIDHGYSMPDESGQYLDERGFFGEARRKDRAISSDVKDAWRGKWDQIETALTKLMISSKAIAKCKTRYDSLLSKSRYTELSDTA